MIIGIIIWLALISLLVGVAFYYIVKAIKKSINRDYKYSINIYKRGFEKGDLPLIKLKIRNKYKYFLIDTGANINMIAHDSYKDIVGKGEVHMVDSVTVSGVNSTDKSAPIPVVEEVISTGKSKFTEKFSINKEWEFTRKTISANAGVDIVGILGSPFFKSAKWVLDLDELVVWVRR